MSSRSGCIPALIPMSWLGLTHSPSNEVYLTAVTTAELRYGVARLPDGRRKTDLADRVRRTVEEDFTGRVLPFDDAALATRNTKDFAHTGIDVIDPWHGAAGE